MNPPKEPLPVRMLNEYAYCPRLFHLMHVEGRWADNTYTIEGRYAHRRVDQLDHVLPESKAHSNHADPEARPPGRAEGSGTPDDGPAPTPGDDPPLIKRSVPLGSETLGLSAKLDLVSIDDQPPPGQPPEAVPVETKRGTVPANYQRSYEPERVQLMAQGLLLREHGYRCDHGVLYFAASRTRVDVPFTPQLEARTHELIELAHEAARSSQLPPPLENSPKCYGCSLAGICLPDETLALQTAPNDPQAPAPDIRRLYPAREDAAPLYIQEQGAYVSKKGQTLVIKKAGEEIANARLKDISQLVLCGNVQASTQTIQQLCEAAIPVVYLSTGHWFYGLTTGITLRNAFDRAAQFRAAENPAACLDFARHIVADKITNQRALLRRNAQPPLPPDVTRDLAESINAASQAESIASLLGIEGNAARIYFQYLARMIRADDFPRQWDFNGRNRRPPRDPVNAMLSFLYAMLVKECTVALLAEGLEPHWGLYHQPRHGRPALALDLMEPLRPLIADSALITAVNTGMIRARHFTSAASACILQPAGRKAMIKAFEARLDQMVTHPAFDYRCSWRSAIRLHARLLARYLRRDVPVYQSITTR